MVAPMRIAIITSVMWTSPPRMVGPAGFSACAESPTEDRLPQVIAPMRGTYPVWLVSPTAWTRDPAKSVWVIARTSETVKIEGHRLDGRGTVSFVSDNNRRASSRTLVVANAAAASVIPGGAGPETMRDYTFLMASIIYPSAGCWEFTVEIGAKQYRVIQLVASSRGEPDDRGEEHTLQNPAILRRTGV